MRVGFGRLFSFVWGKKEDNWTTGQGYYRIPAFDNPSKGRDGLPEASSVKQATDIDLSEGKKGWEWNLAVRFWLYPGSLVEKLIHRDAALEDADGLRAQKDFCPFH